MFIWTSKTWSDEQINELCSKPWKIVDNDGDYNDDWYRDELTHLVIDDHWTYDTLVPSIEQDIKDGLTVEDILEKYVSKKVTESSN
jgi:hypothetical protein